MSPHAGKPARAHGIRATIIDRNAAIPLLVTLLRALLYADADTYDHIERHCGVEDPGMDTAQHDSAKWWTRWRLTRNSSGAEAQVALWKAAWLRGANAVWQHQTKATNPYNAEMQRAAWHAGAKWARENPDRRTSSTRRFAHPRRRAADAKLPTMLKRAVAVSATSLTLYAISKTLWRTKPAAEDAPARQQ